MLAEQVRKREKKKLAQAQVIKDVVDGFLFRGDGRLRLMLEKISALVGLSEGACGAARHKPSKA